MGSKDEMARMRNLAEVTNIMKLYLEALRKGDPDVVNHLFHPEAQLQGVYEGKVDSFPIQRLWDEIRQMGPQPEAVDTMQVLSVDVHVNYGRFVIQFADESGEGFMDAFTLANGKEGGWVVMHKLYQRLSGA